MRQREEIQTVLRAEVIAGRTSGGDSAEFNRIRAAKSTIMSMDLSVWSSQPFTDTALPEIGNWQQYPGAWSHETDDWVVHVLISNDTADDCPVFVRHLIPAAKHVAYVTLEPSGADESGYEFLEKTIRHFARVSNGVWVDGLGTHAFPADEGSF
jgi:hypothetical protein